MKKLKLPFLFALALILPAAAGGYFTALYQIDSLSANMLAEAAAQLGSVDILVVITVVQSIGYALFCGFFGPESYCLCPSLYLMFCFRNY